MPNMSIGLVIDIWPRQDSSQYQELVRMQEKIHLRKTEWPSWELSLDIFLGQLKHSHNFVSFLNRINDDDNLRLSI